MSGEETVFATDEVRCWHRGDEVLIATLARERAPITPGVLAALERALELAASSFRGLVVASVDGHLGFGADLDEGFDALAAGDPKPLDEMLRRYQQTMLGLRHAPVPTVASLHGVAISGGCELVMHCTSAVAHAESYLGLREPLVGVVPGGGGLKDLALRAASSPDLGVAIGRAFEFVAAGGLAMSAEAIERGFLRPSTILLDSGEPLDAAIGHVLALSRDHVPPSRNQRVKVAGRAAIEAMQRGEEARRDRGEITPHQFAINCRLATVLGGGGDADEVDEERLLALEREHLVALAQTKETQDRIHHLRAGLGLLSN